VKGRLLRQAGAITVGGVSNFETILCVSLKQLDLANLIS
jgi:hypothetical protein